MKPYTIAALFAVSPLVGQTITWEGHASSAVGLGARSGSSFAYNPATQRCVMFGGFDSPQYSQETWVWDGATWVDVSPAVSPSGRRGAGLAYEPNTGRLILFGGAENTGVAQGDTWAWDGATWQQLFPNNPPPPRIGMSLALDEARQVIVAFGGVGVEANSLGAETATTYEFDGVDWQERTPAVTPPVRQAAHLFFNVQRGRVQMHGGNAFLNSIIRNDIWEWDGVTWTDLTPAVSPDPRRNAAVAYHRTIQRMVRFGGSLPFFVPHNDQWLWDTQWHDGVLPGVVLPPALKEGAMVFDEARQELVLFRGVPVPPIAEFTWTGKVAYAASSSSYGSSCATSAILESSRPLLGAAVLTQMTLPPSPVAFLAVGWNNASFNGQPLPVDLTAMGMNGCDLLTSSDVVGLTMTAAPGGAWNVFVLPTTPALTGEHVYLQGFALSPGANALGVVTTNGVDWLLGDI